MVGDGRRSADRTAGIELAHLCCEVLEVLFILDLAEFCSPLSLTGSRVGDGEAFSLGLDECIWLNEEALTFVTLPASDSISALPPIAWNTS